MLQSCKLRVVVVVVVVVIVVVVAFVVLTVQEDDMKYCLLSESSQDMVLDRMKFFIQAFFHQFFLFFCQIF